MSKELWDPFADGEGRDLLRNRFGIKTQSALDRVEYQHIGQNITDAVLSVRTAGKLDLKAWQKVHRTLLGSLYPWAGEIRGVEVTRGPVRFNFIKKLAKETDAVFEKASDPSYFSANLGAVYGELAFNHPFLDGNGRSLNTVFTELARRAGFGIAWDQVEKKTYLAHLTNAVLAMEYEGLDRYLNALKVPLVGYNPDFTIVRASTPSSERALSGPKT